jgi:Ca-activated chloride channel family protein
MSTVVPHYRFAAVGLILILCTSADLAVAQVPASVRLTSPLGRTGIIGTIRLVAHVVTPVPDAVVPVRFYVDGRLLAEDADGPPYAVEWVDDNPYEPREIKVAIDDGAGGVLEDSVKLAPLEVIEEAQVASVLVDASVTDEHGKAVATLGGEDFTLTEDGVVQSLDLVQLQRMPTQFTLLVDASQSMARRVDLVRATARRVVARLRAEDTVVVAPFRRSVETVTGPTRDSATIAEAIGGISASGGTAIFDSLAQLPELLSRTDVRHVVILLTDGYDEHSRGDMQNALDAVRALNATIYVVGIGGVAGISLKGELLLRQIAAKTGGRTFFPSREEQLPDVHEAIMADVFSRYLLSYTPANQEPDGAYRAITVATADSRYRIKAREGYFAPKPPPIRPTLEFSARAENGENVALSASDFTITEDGAEQRIEAFHEANAPVSIVLALDGSGSMKPAIDAARAAARAFVESLRPSDPVALVQFADGVVFAHELSTNRRLSIEAIDAHAAAGGTALWDALYGSIQFLSRHDGRRAVVVVTDGRDENNPGTAPGSQRTLEEVLEHVKGTDTTVYAIGLGPKVDREGLTLAAAASGGRAYFPEDVTVLADHYRRVLEDLRRRYVVTYTSTNSKRDGSWRVVEITTTRPGIVISSRNGYKGPEHASPSVAQR